MAERNVILRQSNQGLTSNWACTVTVCHKLGVPPTRITGDVSIAPPTSPKNLQKILRENKVKNPAWLYELAG
jgi:hypothetical protein